MRAVSLFSGGLGLDLGLEEAGIEAACYVEADADCLRLIRSRRPGVPVLEDVKEATAETLAGEVEVVAGGFPCQDLSYAGRGAGLHEGERSALWFEMLRIVEDVKPRLVLAENVPGLLTRGLPVVLHGLARAGYVGRWFAVSAASVGAPHLRERIFVAARRVDAGVRAERLGAGHPVGEFRDEGWFDLQGSLFDQEPLRRLGKRGRWTLEAVFEEDARLALDDGAEETLLPTPSAYESTPTAEFIDEVREAGVDPEARLYLPGRKWHAQRTLSRIAPLVGEVGQDPEALLPTPQGSDGERGPDYARQRERRESHGSGGDDLTTTVAKMLPTPAARDAKGPNPNDRDGGEDLPTAAQKLLPTPVVTDSFGSRRSTARTDEWTSNPGTTLTDAIWEAQGRETDTTGKLLPTPTAATGGDGERPDGFRRLLAPEIRRLQDEALLPTPTATYPGGSEEDFLERKGREPDGAIHLNHAVEKLLPTPKANASGGPPSEKNEETLRTGRRPSGQPATFTLGTVVERLLPTPVANPDNPGSGGELRAAIEHGPERRNGTGVDSLGCPNEGRPSRLLPTPQAADGDGGRQEKGAMRAGGKRPSGQKGTLPLGTAVTLADEIGESPFTEQEPTERLLPTPQAQEPGRKSEQARRPRGGDGQGSPPGLIEVVQTQTSWGVYEAAVRRWEATCGREAPAPTDDRGRLSPAFVTWMLGYPEGWVDVDGISRTAQLRILGNSVQVQVAAIVGRRLLALDRELSL